MKRKILIVEDEFIVADDLQLTLEGAGYDVCGIAASVAEAREIMRSAKPGLVLLDIHLKGRLSGIELAKELKEESIAFVYLSANSNQQILEAAKATDPYGFLVKPFREKDLLVTLDIAFYRHEHSLEARWHKEIQLQKELANIQTSTSGTEEKLMQMTRVLQRYIPVDLFAARFGKNSAGTNNFLGVLRTGFDEYVFLHDQELSNITGKKKEEAPSRSMDIPEQDLAGNYKGDDFKTVVDSFPDLSLLTRKLKLASCLILPVINSDGFQFSICLFRSVSEGYTNEQFEWMLRLAKEITAVLDSISPRQKEALFSPQPVTKQAPLAGDSKPVNCFQNIIGNSSSLLNVLDLVAQVAPLDTSVLILGESGTGKEKIANCIHQLSPRKHMPFVKINCAAMPLTLIESELFGHEKGAFTGASERKTGKFELADKGTIFLDEIGEMPVELQVKLLRVLQEKEIERVGGRLPIKVDVRVITATNRNLETEMAAGKFRLDLYYRLNVFPVTLPPLRERKEDIASLARFFAEQFCKKFTKPFPGISSAMLAELEDHDWPGNIRELENVMEKSIILNDGKSPLILKQPLFTVQRRVNPEAAHGMNNPAVRTIDDIKRLQRQTEIDHITSVLVKTHGRIRGKDGAAELLNEKPTTLESRIAKLGLRKEDFQ